MSESIHRRRVPAAIGSRDRSPRIRRKEKQQPSRQISDRNRSKPTKILDRSFSESNLRYRRGGGGDDDDHEDRRRMKMSKLPAEESDRLPYLHKIRSEVFASFPLLSGYTSPFSSPPIIHEGYKKEAKVVISVSVEGSPGPVRTMVNLGCNVQETINLVLEKYHEEGRTPKLNQEAAFALHQSHFSLQCLDKATIIGEVGSRSFYLRKKGLEDDDEPKPCASEIIPDGPNLQSSNVIQLFIARKVGKIVRRMRKIWNILVCMR